MNSNLIQARITGTRPLLMHSNLLADPLHPKTKIHKELTSKRKKTDEDLESIAQSEWACGLYIDEKGPYIPGINLEASILAGAKMSRLGKNVGRSVEVIEDRCYIEYKGPKTVEGLWKDQFYDVRGVRIGGRSTIMRYRPIFREWACNITLAFNGEDINKADVIKSLQDAGQYVGVGDYRPKFGRFSVEII